MDYSSKLMPIFEGKMKREDTQNGAHHKKKYKVELGAILITVQFYL